MAFDGTTGYASDYQRNGLFKVDACTGECIFLKLFCMEPVGQARLHCQAIIDNNKVYFIPASGKGIDVFNLNDCSMEYYALPLSVTNKYSFYNARFKFISAIKYQKALWLFPSTYPGVVRFDIETHIMTVFNQWIEQDDYFFRFGFYLEQNKFILANGKSNAVLIFDLIKEEGEIIHIGKNNHGVMSIQKVNDTYWFAPRRPGAIVSWNSLTNEVNEYMDFPDEFFAGDIVFTRILYSRNRLVFPPAKANCAITISDGKLIIDNSFQWKTQSQSIVECLFETEDKWFYREATKNKGDRLFTISKIDNEQSNFCFSYEDNGERDRKIIEECGNRILHENKIVGLSELIHGIK